MMKVIGIDVSKLHLDLALLDQDGKVLQEAHISNKASCLRKLLRSWIKGQCSGARMLVCLEPTGPYSFEAIKTMLAMGVPVWLAHPADIKNSLGMPRVKSDQVDARRIAQYALRFGDKARFLDETFLHLQELKDLLAARDQFVRERAKYRMQQGDQLKAMQGRAKACFKRCSDNMIAALTRSIAYVEKQVEAFLTSDPQLSLKRDLAMSVTGIGPVLSGELLVVTRGFTRFTDPRQLVCYAGLAPYDYSSGTSIRGRTGVSEKANQYLKSLFHMAALNAVKVPGDLQTYYQRKLAHGKAPMTALNAVRAKIVHHLWAVLESGIPYTRFKHPLQMP